MKYFGSELDGLRAVAAACLDASGVLVEANAGFLRLLDESAIAAHVAGPLGARVPAFFIQPAFSELVAAPADETGLVHEGLITVGNRDAVTRTLKGRVWRQADGLRVLAEHDIEELERMVRHFLDLNQEMIDAHLQAGRANLQLRQREARIMETSLTDALTGAGNRRRLEQALAEEMSRVRRDGQPLSAFMADLDFFKSVNDTYGHAAGDRVLVRFSALMREQLRATDVLGRYGGEEFVVLMPGTRLAEGILIAERIRAALAAEIIPPLPAPVTASFGVAQLREDEGSASLIERIDRAMYEAKAGGRNKVMAARLPAAA